MIHRINRDARQTKNSLRKKMREMERKRSGAPWKARADKAILDSIAALEKVGNAKVVAGFSSMPGEVDLLPLLANLAEDGKKVCLPRSSSNEDCEHGESESVTYVLADVDSETLYKSLENDVLTHGAFGIAEPLSTSKVVPCSMVDVWLVPALAFDDRGNRLGRGGGFYDRFLANVAGLKIGVGYECVILNELPCDDWDQRMDLIVTERRLLWI